MHLLHNEALDFTHPQPTETSLINDTDINQKYVKGEVRIVTEQARYPLDSIKLMVESPKYKLNPEYQRRHRWDNEKKSRLIESLIMNVPVPPIFLYEFEYSHYEVMDGLQRLTAIKEFYSDTLVLEGLQEWPELNHRTYSQLPDQVKHGIDRRYLSSIILLEETAKTPEEAQRLKQLVFERINSGGVKLEPQESRNAIYNGRLNTLCMKLARDENLCNLWNIPGPTPDELDNSEHLSEELLENEDFRRMTDVELVLRFFANRQRENYRDMTLKSYLDIFLKYGNAYNDLTLNALGHLFQDTIKLAYDVLGEKAFFLGRLRGDTWSWYSKPTTVVYDPLMRFFSQNLGNANSYRSSKEKIQNTIPEFYKKNYDSFKGRYTNVKNILEREQLYKGFFEGFSS